VVAQFFRLKLQLLGNSFRRSPWQLVGLIVGLIYGFVVCLIVVSALLGLRAAPADVAAVSVTLFGGILVLGFMVVPLVFGVDDTMDPRRFSLFGIPTSRLANALGLAALISTPSVVVAFIALAQIVTWSRGPLSVLLALIGAPVILATCVLCARVFTSIAAFLLATRRARDIMGVISIAALFAVAALVILIFRVDWQTSGIAVLGVITAVLGWTPLGAAWAAPAMAATGHAGSALLMELIALAFVGVLWLVWRYLVKVMLVTPERTTPAHDYSGIGFFTFGSGQTAAIAARSLTYWARDARYQVSLVVIPIVPFILVTPLAFVGVPATILALFPVPVMALFLSWSIHNDVAYDNTAVWLHVASGTRGSSDRLGRIVPPLVVGIPLLVVAALICAPITGDEGQLPAIIGVGIGLLLTGLGPSSVMSARFPYPAVRPGDSPFAQPQATGSASALIQGLSFGATILLASPTLALAVLSAWLGSGWAWPTLFCGLVLGVLVLWGGVALGGFVFDRRAPELLAFSVRN
jgi:ABC-2 type transport system permease protein